MFSILFRHADFIAINKLPGIGVHQDKDSDGLTRLLAAQLGLERVWLVHRLDKPTSGVLLFALNEQAFKKTKLDKRRHEQSPAWCMETHPRDGKPRCYTVSQYQH